MKSIKALILQLKIVGTRNEKVSLNSEDNLSILWFPRTWVYHILPFLVYCDDQKISRHLFWIKRIINYLYQTLWYHLGYGSLFTNRTCTFLARWDGSILWTSSTPKILEKYSSMPATSELKTGNCEERRLTVLFI